ncbi:MAG: peptide chain release factor N(5)-glutamine methyltransferase [Deltaproteobacteria bacterium]|nr:peptide chain release factor N(5)-glutamine methyltransferase [Deltaproteobacteria bacterium]
MRAATERVWTIRDVLNWTIAHLKSKQVTQPRATAEVLLAHALGVDRISLYINFDKPLNPDERAHFRRLIKRRLAGEPTQYITGRQEFWSLSFQVNPHVLIPRPETELMVEESLRLFRDARPSSVLELGTGSGAVIVALAKELDSDIRIATDRSVEAVFTARRNAESLGFGGRIQFLAADLFQPFKTEPVFDLIVSNPPYVSPEEYADLPREIKDFEPREALMADRGGLAVLHRILKEAPSYLKPRGWLLLEIGCTQKERVLKIAEQMETYVDVSVLDDYSDRPRLLRVQRG